MGKPAHRFFFALFPPIGLARAIVQKAGPLTEGARMMRPERLHVTLDILDDFVEYPNDIAQALIAAGARVSAAPVEVTLDRLSGGAHTIALRPRLRQIGLHRLQRSIATARDAAGIRARAGYRFSPHMTLSYRTGAPFSRPVAPIAWQAAEFVLIHSLIGRTVHEVIGRWPLTGGADMSDPAQPALF